MLDAYRLPKNQMSNNPEINKALEKFLCFVLVFLNYNPTKILF